MSGVSITGKLEKEEKKKSVTTFYRKWLTHIVHETKMMGFNSPKYNDWLIGVGPG